MCKTCEYSQIMVKNCTWWKITLCHEVLYECLGGGDKWWEVLGKLSESYVGTKRVWECMVEQWVGDREIFLKISKQGVLDVFLQNWSERLSMSSRAVFYRSVKENWVFSEYLEMVHVTEHRQALCRLIISSHQLRIDTGRWEGPSVWREMRHCELCNTDAEDEFHFMLKCPVYASIRKQSITGYYWRRQSMYK